MEILAPKPSSCGACIGKPAASWCLGCPREKGDAVTPFHFVGDARLTRAADVVVIAESPVTPRIIDASKLHRPFADDGGALVKRAIEAAQASRPEFANLRVQESYAVLCASNQGDKEPTKAVLDRCKNFLHTGLATVTALNGGRTPTILAMGMSAVKALGIKASSLKAVQSRILRDVELDGRSYNVVVTISTKQLVAMAGMYNTFFNDLTRALQVATGDAPEDVPMEELTKGYTIPRTVEEVKAICEEIVAYSEGDKSPDSWSISVDTETNTLFPHRDTLKVLCVSFAWATGKATAIPLWHPETPYDPALVVPYVRSVLESKKPKSFHNAKFDLKVFKKLGWPVNNFIWDTMLAEHALEEDKKGQYGLKELTRVFLPEFASYADTLQEMLEKEEGGSQLENIRRERRKAAKEEVDSLQGKKKLSKRQMKQMDGGFEKIPLDTLLPYAAIDTDMTRRISIRQLQRIAAEEREVREKKKFVERDKRRRYPVPNLCDSPSPVQAIVRKHAVPAVRTLGNMEFRGIRVDRPYLETLQEGLGAVIETSAAALFKMTSGKDELKLNSAAAVANLLFSEGFIHPSTGERTVHPITKEITTTKKGQYQTTEKVLRFLEKAYGCPFSTKKLIYAKAYKAKNTFCKNVWDLSALDGFLHTNYNIHGTSTGRLSSSDENMQNIPKKLGGYNIKKIFTPSDDSMVFVNADAKAAEVRILTAYSRDPELIRSLNEGLDTHAFIAAKIVDAVRLEPGAKAVLAGMGMDDSLPLTYDDFCLRDAIRQTNPQYGEMLDKFRTAVKRVVFGILYGAGARKIAETIGISLDQAQAIIDLLFQLFPSIPRYMEQTKWELQTFGYVETFFGRRRRFSVRGAANYLRSRAERQTVNFKIQSTSSEIVLDCLVGMEAPLQRDLGGRLLLTVHDSIGFEIPKRYLSQLPDFVDYYLEKTPKKKYPWLPVDFKWDFELGDNYGELKPYDVYLKNLITQEPNYASESEEAYSEEEIRIELSREEDAA